MKTILKEFLCFVVMLMIALLTATATRPFNVCLAVEQGKRLIQDIQTQIYVDRAPGRCQCQK